MGPGIAGQYLVLLDDTVLPRIGSNCYCGGEGLLLLLLWIMLQLQAFMDPFNPWLVRGVTREY